MSDPSLVKRLKDRRLVQWSIAYLAGAWTLVEATGVVAEQFGWPSVFGRIVIVVAFFGFLITLVLSWYHGEKGRQRVSGPELFMIAALLTVAATVLSRLTRDTGQEGNSAAPAAIVVDDPRPAIAVLPCENFSPDDADEYFASGIHGEILLRLQRISGLASIGRASVLRYRDSRPSTDQISNELGVGFVGECSVRRDVDQVRMTFRLLEARTGRQLWAENYDRRLLPGTLFSIQSDIARRVAAELRAQLTPAEQVRLDAEPTASMAAYDRYLLGRQSLNTGAAPGMRTAVRHFEEALSIDPGFAPGFAGLAEAYASLGYFNVIPPDEAWPRARAAALQAIELDEELASAHTTLGRVEAWFSWDWLAAEREFARAIELNPNDAESRLWLSRFLSSIQEHDRAVQQANRAVALDPRSVLTRFFRIGSLFYGGRHQEALELAVVESEEDPSEPLYYWWIALSHSRDERWEDALPPLLTQVELMGGDVSDELGHLGYIYGRMGRRAEAREVLEHIKERAADGTYVSPVSVSWVHIGLGDYDEAFVWLERGFESRANWILSLNIHPLFDPIRADSRFGDLIRRVGLPRAVAGGR